MELIAVNLCILSAFWTEHVQDAFLVSNDRAKPDDTDIFTQRVVLLVVFRGGLRPWASAQA
jgi:hypothetical protein